MNRGDRITVLAGPGEVRQIEDLVAELGPLLTVPVAAWVIGVSDSALRCRIERRTLTVVVIGGSPWVPLREVVTPRGKAWELAKSPESVGCAEVRS